VPDTACLVTVTVSLLFVSVASCAGPDSQDAGQSVIQASRRENLAVKSGLKILVVRPVFTTGCCVATTGACDSTVRCVRGCDIA
jgi:hypothetical protein